MDKSAASAHPQGAAEKTVIYGSHEVLEQDAGPPVKLRRAPYAIAINST